jgi:hypothetical protein
LFALLVRKLNSRSAPELRSRQSVGRFLPAGQKPAQPFRVYS